MLRYALAFLLTATPVLADDHLTFTTVIKDHKFSPAEITVPAGQKFKLIVDNQDPTPEEFESHSLKREKIITGNSKGIILLGPLEPGTHQFFGEFNEATAQGRLIVKE